MLMDMNTVLMNQTQVVITALNEEEGIGPTLAELTQYLGSVKIIVVDGKSTDRTVEVAKNIGAEITFQDGVGKGDALAKGISRIDPNVEYVVVTDADFTYPADQIPQMIQILKTNPLVGMVCGNRFAGRTDTDAFHSVFSFGNKLIQLAHNLLNGVTLQDPLTGLRVIRASLLRNWYVKSKGFEIEVELNYYVERSGYEIVEVPIGYRPRLGEKKLKMSDGLIIFKRILIEMLC